MTARHTWWTDAVIYQVYVRSFADGDGDGIGDLLGVRQRLPDLADLGVDGIWITPFYPSPGHDHGYDVADYCDVDPVFGDLDAFDGLVEDARRLGLRIIVDLVPNHTSSEHEWFVDAVSGRDSAKRDWYLFVEGEGEEDDEPPNNWGSVFGGPAWSKEPNGEDWYLHLFAPEQPDLNWRNPDVVDAFDDILRFWLDRGVDGFRIDVAHGLFKDAALRDNPSWPDAPDGATPFEATEQKRTFDQPEVHDVYRRWRRLVDSYPGDRMLVGEVFLWEPERVAAYVRPDELHQAFNFALLGQPWKAEKFRDAISRTIAALGAVGASPSWVLSNHDVVRHVTRYGGGETGRRRARAALLLTLGLPGVTYLYQGEELGLEEVAVPPEARQDPVAHHSERVGRDGCRVGLPWRSEPFGYGFTTGSPWLPFPDGWGDHAHDLQSADDTSMLTFYREAIAARRSLDPRPTETTSEVGGTGDCVVVERGPFTVVLNMGQKARAHPARGELVLASDPDGTVVDGDVVSVPGDAAVWLLDRGQD